MKACILPFLLSTAALCGQDYFSIEWSSVSGGGQSAESGPGEFTVESTIGLLTTGVDSAGFPGEFGVSSGYWSFTLNEPLDLGLAVHIAGGSLSLTWDDSTGVAVRLEGSADLQLWVPVNPQPQHPPFLEPAVQRRFFRLMPVP